MENIDIADYNDEEKESKYSKYEIIALVISAIAFAAALLSMIFSLDTLISLACFTVHAIADLLFAMALITKKEKTDDVTDRNIKPPVEWIHDKEILEQEKGQAVRKLESAELKIVEVSLANETLTSRTQDLEKQVEELNSRIEAMKAANAMETSQMLTAKAEMSILPPTAGKKETVNISQIARSAVSDLSAAAARAGLDIRFNPTSEELLVKAEPDRLRILFRNIIDNSIKYMGGAGVLVITISALEDIIFIILKDNGLGLPSEEVKHIFELNYQGSNRISGNGLGLSQAKAIVEYYGGNIYAKSTEHGGMGIYIQLPAN